MIAPYTLEMLAETRGAELRREADVARLAALVACCRPRTWARAARRAVTAAARLRHGAGSPACCATA